MKSIDPWLAALDERHFANLTQSEVTRALRALSSCYVERREKLTSGGALDGAGKRAAFALFYGPQHFFISREIAHNLWPAGPPFERIVDLGCGTGTAGAAIALASGAAVEGVDLNRWAVTEANWTYSSLGVKGRATVSNIRNLRITATPKTLILGAYAVNELPEDVRAELLERLQTVQKAGASLLIVEPIGRRVNLWWPKWKDAFQPHGAREDEWRFRLPLPPRQRALAKGAGLDVQAQTAKSLFIPGGN